MMFWLLHFPSMGHVLEFRQLQLPSLVASALLIWALLWLEIMVLI